MRWLGRLGGAVIGGGGTWIALSLVSWAPGVEIAVALSLAMAIAGFALGPKVWQAVATWA